ncbi:MAG: RidA family protein [Candidatus Binatia bacterium]
MKPSERLTELGLTLPVVAAPVGSYVPAIQTGSHILTSGQLPFRDGAVVYTGKVPRETTVEDAMKGAEIAAINAVAAAAHQAGGIDAIRRVIRVAVFVNSSPGFTEQPKVANGASDLLAKMFGDAGKHVRAAIGVSELPLNAAVELELTVEV